MPKTDPVAAEMAQQTVKRILLAFNAAYKKLNLYSERHNIYKDAMHQCTDLLVAFLEENGSLRLRIERNRMIYNDETVYEGASESTDLVSILHRDGILWVEFQPGIGSWELDAFLKVLRDYSVLDEDAEDDIVTALWEHDFPSIAHEADELVLGLGDDLVMEEFPCCPPESLDAPNQHDDAQGQAGAPMQAAGATVDAAALDVPADSLQLSREEREQLERMVAAEERPDGSDHIVDVLLYIIERHCLPEDVEELLAYMTQALREALLDYRFSYLRTVLMKFRKQHKAFKSASHWASPYLERFLRTLSSTAFLKNLIEISPMVEKTDVESLKDLKPFLALLNNEAISALAPIMMQSRSPRLQRLLLGTIAGMARRDIQPLEKLLVSSDKALAGRLVIILKFFDDDHSRGLLSKLLRDDSEIIRKQALKAVLGRSEPTLAPEEVFALIDDTDPGVRGLILRHLGRERSVLAENLLLDYLQSGHGKLGDSDHFVAVCRSLGKCASDRSVPLLKSLLFKFPRLGVLRSRKSVKRQAATAALRELRTEKASALVERTGRGFFGNLLRSA